jgi:putative protein kinase ArgK-like GTPase of G3E family
MTRRSAAKPSTGDLVERLLNGAPGALAKAITIVENGGELAADILAGIESRRGCALVLGITGAPGAGKSTLLSALVGELRRRGKTVGVLAIDPSSPLTGGAILGDRIRMVDHACDSDVFVRSLASRGHVGGLSAAAGRIVHLMDAAGKDVVIVETVGAGQSDVEVDRLADITIVVCAPGLGDEIQAISRHWRARHRRAVRCRGRQGRTARECRPAGPDAGGCPASDRKRRGRAGAAAGQQQRRS